ncbi:unnamed protein product [Nezara viridula]|uniref:Uncharacterized protein n=1 Tax=Nezara viridula TaxID=85310 RepID=A0A9P0HNA7_NEZVI|nr:unnamed protein product [Nezara viridula]
MSSNLCAEGGGEIKCNEKADALARNGAEFPIVGPEPTIGIFKKHQRKEVLDWTWKKAGKEWRECIGLREAKQFYQKPLSLQNKVAAGPN